MAYVDHRGFAAAAGAPSRAADSPSGLGRDEWSVVEFACNDGLWSLNPDGFVQRLVRILFGIRPPRPLANERLEALRRFAVVAWSKGAVRAAQLNELRAAGFSDADAEAVLAHVGQRRQSISTSRGIA